MIKSALLSIHKLFIIRLLQWPELQIALGSMLISFSPVFVRLVHTPPTIAAFYRMLIGGILLTSIALISKQQWKFSVRALSFTFFAGLFFALYLTFWHRSILQVGPGLATILISLQVFILGIIGIIFFGESVTRRFIYAIPLVLLGMYLLVGISWLQDSPTYHYGVMLGLTGMLFYSTYLYVLRQSQYLVARISVLCNIALLSLFGAIILAFISHQQHESFVITRWQDGVWLFCYGLFSQTIGWWLIAHGLPKTRLSLAGFLLLLQPTFAFIWDVILFHRPTEFHEVVGALVTLLAIYYAATARKIVVRLTYDEKK